MKPSSIDTLKEMIALEQQRASVQSSLASILARLDQLKQQLFTDTPAPKAATPKAATPKTTTTPSAPKVTRGRRKNRARRGALASLVLAHLRSVGSTGSKVREVAEALSMKPANIHSWFHAAIKSGKGITKNAAGRYVLTGGAAAEAPVAKKPAPAPSAKKTRGVRASAGKKPGARGSRGPLREQIEAALKAAGKEGLPVKSIADKIGANARNIYVWFATTGKKNPAIKKVGPGHYSMA